jgi:tetratricopeptide (TPR) repeat protein
MSAHQTTIDTRARNHELNVRVLRYRHRPEREEPALLARELLQLGRHADALELTELALAREPGDPDLELVRAQALLAIGDAHRGEQQLIRVAKAAPDWAAPLSALTRLLSGRGDEARALRVAHRARTLGADDTMVGRLAAQDAATRLLDARVARFRADAHSEEPVMLARALELADRKPEALAVLREALARDPEDADTLAALARVERAAGRAEEAIALYRKARAAAPGWETVESALLSLVGLEVPIEVMEPRTRSAFGAEPSVVVDEDVYAEARAFDLDAELDALLAPATPRGEPTAPHRLDLGDTLVGAPAIARSQRTTPRAAEPTPARRSTSGFPTRPVKRSAASAPSAYVRVLAGDARRHVH